MHNIQEGECGVTQLILHEAAEGFSCLPEPPLAYQDSENIITKKSVAEWLVRLQDRLRKKDSLRGEVADIVGGETTADALLGLYHRLRFISRKNALEALALFSQDIQTRFKPERTLIYIDKGSSSFLYQLIKSKLPQYGTYTWRRPKEREIMDRAGYTLEDIGDATSVVFIDDWLLSAMQFGERIFPRIGQPIDRVHTYHLALSEAGASLMNSNHVDSRSIWGVRTDTGAKRGFRNYPVYAFHKVPDNIPSYYADSSNNSWGVQLSIFPGHTESGAYAIGGDTKLEEYASQPFSFF